MKGETSYDQIPYQSDPFPETHPDHLGTIALLFGMNPAPIQVARVLEIGSSSGNNIIPHAALHPDSSWLGIDLSEVQIAAGNKLLAELAAAKVKIPNIELRRVDLNSVLPADLGEFDYIIAHGFLSWVPPETQQNLFELLPQILAPDGVAYVSFNTFPGWHTRMTLRTMIKHHIDGAASPLKQIEMAREFLATLQIALISRSDLTAQALAEQISQIETLPDWYLFHDLLEDENHPFLLSDVFKMARESGLQYLGDSLLPKMAPFDLPDEVYRYIRNLSSEPEAIEQYLDMFRCEYFRRSLFCRADVKLTRDRWFERIGELSFRAKPIDSILGGGERQANLPNLENLGLENLGGGFEPGSTDWVAKIALDIIRTNWPQPISCREVMETLGQITPEKGDAEAKFQEQLAVVVELAFQGAMSGTISLHRWAPPVAARLLEKPLVTPLARYEARIGNQVTSLFHVPLQIGDELKSLIPLMDGTRTIEQLAEQSGMSLEECLVSLDRMLREGMLVEVRSV